MPRTGIEPGALRSKSMHSTAGPRHHLITKPQIKIKNSMFHKFGIWAHFLKVPLKQFLFSKKTKACFNKLKKMGKTFFEGRSLVITP